MADSCATCSFSRAASGQARYDSSTHKGDYDLLEVHNRPHKVLTETVRLCQCGPPQVLPTGRAQWPIVGDGDWCGQFKAVAAP
jgi:hypothetical protein